LAGEVAVGANRASSIEAKRMFPTARTVDTRHLTSLPPGITIPVGLTGAVPVVQNAVVHDPKVVDLACRIFFEIWNSKSNSVIILLCNSGCPKLQY
jgi:hypothetical protein